MSAKLFEEFSESIIDTSLFSAEKIYSTSSSMTFKESFESVDMLSLSYSKLLFIPFLWMDIQKRNQDWKISQKQQYKHQYYSWLCGCSCWTTSLSSCLFWFLCVFRLLKKLLHKKHILLMILHSIIPSVPPPPHNSMYFPPIYWLALSLTYLPIMFLFDVRVKCRIR